MDLNTPGVFTNLVEIFDEGLRRSNGGPFLGHRPILSKKPLQYANYHVWQSWPEVDARRRGDASIRIDHVAYRVADLDAAVEALIGSGAKLVGPDDSPLEQPLEMAGSRHVWLTLGDQRLQLLQ